MASTDTSRESDILSLANDIESWLSDHLKNSGAERFVLALSGGIDSALVCGLATRAVGADRVLGVLMPSSSNPDDAASAHKVAAAFGVRTLTIDLTGPTDALKSVLPAAEDVAQSLETDHLSTAGVEQLANANLKPRLRMTTVYYVANLCSGIVLGTGNKSEAMIGYFTKYGDGGVDLLPIVDLYKFEVREMSRAIGVPDSVVRRPPSAGLWEGQTDEHEIGLSYEELDNALIAIARNDTSEIEPDVLGKVQQMIAGSQHKRTPIPAFRRS